MCNHFHLTGEIFYIDIGIDINLINSSSWARPAEIKTFKGWSGNLDQHLTVVKI